jgi:hypothetical protein
MKLIKKFEEYTNKTHFCFLATGELVKINESHIHKGIKPYLKKILSEIEGGENFIKKERKFPFNIGVTYCVKVSNKDNNNIYYKRRKNRKDVSKMVSNRIPEPCDTITIILRKRKQYYFLLTTYIGYLAESEIWDQNSFDKTNNPELAKQKAEIFWNNHALIDENHFLEDE